MRSFLLACLVLWVAPHPGAQSLADSEERFGLAVGNVWEYARTEGVPWVDSLRVVGHERWEIVRLDVVGGERRFVLEGGRLGEPTESCVLMAVPPPYITYDFVLSVSGACTFGDLAARDYGGIERAFVARVGRPVCGELDSPWDAPGEPGPLCGMGGEFGMESRGGGVSVTAAAQSVSGFGIVHAWVLRDSSATAGPEAYDLDTRYLTFVRVDGVEYGASRATAAGALGPPAARPLRVGPNPARGAATVWGADGATVVLVDPLGRVVRRVAAAPGPVRIGLSGLPPGVYAVRAGRGAAVPLTVVR